jgi:DNA gyrase subunit A
VIGRSTQGVKLMDLEGEDRIVAAAKLAEREEEDVVEGGPEPEPEPEGPIN